MKSNRSTSKLNLHRHVSDDLRVRLRTGKLTSGERLPTYAEMISTYGVSANVVSKALQSLEADGLVTRRQGRGVYVSTKPVAKRTTTIGWMVPKDLEANSYCWDQISRGARIAAAELGVDLLYVADVNSESVGKVSGCVFQPNWLTDAQIDLLETIPTVQIADPRLDALKVTIDEFRVGVLAAEHLIALGHRKIGWLMHVVHTIPQHRLAGALMAMRLAGLTYSESNVRDLDFTPDMIARGRHAMRSWLDEGRPDVTAIIAQNDLVAIGAMQVLRERGIRVPKDISIIGVDGSREGECSTPALTTVVIPFAEIGGEAVRLLVRRINGTGADPRCAHVWAPNLKLGGSTAPPK